ncbi:hypothetical protein JVU11DRAFT_12453 [Chiua virens]|nr:hypothetical protein JVU11DRAFT_12453 [Chiua virens]
MPFRRAVNLVGGLVENVDKINANLEDTGSDLSGVFGVGANESDRYNELIEMLVIYLGLGARCLERILDEAMDFSKPGEGSKQIEWGKTARNFDRTRVVVELAGTAHQHTAEEFGVAVIVAHGLRSRE